jgi:hypothetical protein
VPDIVPTAGGERERAHQFNKQAQGRNCSLQWPRKRTFALPAVDSIHVDLHSVYGITHSLKAAKLNTHRDRFYAWDGSVFKHQDSTLCVNPVQNTGAKLPTLHSNDVASKRFSHHTSLLPTGADYSALLVCLFITATHVFKQQWVY